MTQEQPRLSAQQIEKGWRDTFSTSNPFCPCDLKTFTKAARWTEHALSSRPSGQEAQEALRQISEHVTVMLGSAQPVFENQRHLSGYQIRTGALHKIIGLLSGTDYPVSVPLMKWRGALCHGTGYTQECGDSRCTEGYCNAIGEVSVSAVLSATPATQGQQPAGKPDMAKIEQDALSNAALLILPKITQAYRYFYAQGKTEEDFDRCAWDAMAEAIKYAVKLTAREVRDPVWPYALSAQGQQPSSDAKPFRCAADGGASLCQSCRPEGRCIKGAAMGSTT